MGTISAWLNYFVTFLKTKLYEKKPISVFSDCNCIALFL